MGTVWLFMHGLFTLMMAWLNERVSHLILPAGGKNKNSKSEVQFLLNAYRLKKILNQAIVNWGLSVSNRRPLIYRWGNETQGGYQ